MNIRRIVRQMKIPLLNKGKKNPRAVQEDLKRGHSYKPADIAVINNKYAVVKPERQLGAPHIADRVALRKNVRLCDTCWRRYYGWWRRYEYRPDWSYYWRSNCDGCSMKMILCICMYPEENFYRCLTESFGHVPEPNRKIYRI
jgi:hypothetical protein